MYFSSNEEEPAACLPVIKNNLTTTKSESEFFWFALVFVTLQLRQIDVKNQSDQRGNSLYELREYYS